MTAWSKEAARSALVVSSSKLASLEEGKDIGTLTRFWTVRRKAVLRPEKEKSRELASG